MEKKQHKGGCSSGLYLRRDTAHHDEEGMVAGTGGS